MKNLFIFVVLLLFGFRAFAQGNDGTTLLWSQNYLSGNINDKVKVTFSEKIQYNSDADEINYYHTDITVLRKLNKNFSTGVGFRTTNSGGKGKWASEIRYMGYVVYSGKYKNWSANWSNRLEYRTFETASSHFRYQNFFTLNTPFCLTPLHLKPYLAEESFIKLNDEGFHQGRIYGGFHALNIRFLAIDIFYCRQFSKSNSDWKKDHVWGLNLKCQI